MCINCECKCYRKNNKVWRQFFFSLLFFLFWFMAKRTTNRHEAQFHWEGGTPKWYMLIDVTKRSNFIMQLQWKFIGQWVCLRFNELRLVDKYLDELGIYRERIEMFGSGYRLIEMNCCKYMTRDRRLDRDIGIIDRWKDKRT